MLRKIKMSLFPPSQVHRPPGFYKGQWLLAQQTSVSQNFYAYEPGKGEGKKLFPNLFPFSFFFFLSLLPKPPASPAPMTMWSFRINLGVSPLSSHQPNPNPSHPLVILCSYTERSLSSNSACFIFALDLTCTSLPLPSWQLRSRPTSPVSSEWRKLDNPPTYWRPPNPKRCFSSPKVFSRALQIQRISLLPSRKHWPWTHFWNHRHQPGSGSWPRLQKWSVMVLSFPSTNNYNIRQLTATFGGGDVHTQSAILPEAEYGPRILDFFFYFFF